MKFNLHSLFLAAILCLCFWPSLVINQSLMAIDVGMESVKVSITKPGTPMTVVLNKDSYRKTKNALSFVKDVRYIGDGAVKMARKFPQYTAMHPSFLVGKRYDSKLHKIYQARWPKVTLEKDPESDSILFRFKNSEDVYSAEALFAMNLVDARDFTELFLDGKINSISLALPAYSDQTTRQYMKESAQIADLKMISIIDSNVASCIKYSIGKRKSLSKTEYHRVMIVDVGAYKTDASIFDCINKVESEKYSSLYPHCQLKGYGYTLKGAADLDYCIADILKDKFTKKFNVPYETVTNDRIDFTILQQANKLKHLISSVDETKFNLEQIYNGKDWSDSISRKQVEDKCSSIVHDMLSAIDQSLKVLEIASERSKNKDKKDSLPLKQVVLMGGGTRIPLVQSVIQKKTGISSLSKSLNTDDDISLGASFKTAAVSKFFRVAHIECDSGTIYPINVTYDKTEYDADGKMEKNTYTKRLFDIMSPNRVGKVLTLKNVTDDIELTFKYDLTDLPYTELSVVDSLFISRVTIKGIPEVIEKHKENYIYDKLRVHISHDNFGLLTITGADAVFKRDESKLSMINKFTNAITDFFKDSSSEGKDDQIELTENLDFKLQNRQEKTTEESAPDSSESEDPTKTSEYKDLLKNLTDISKNFTAFNGTEPLNMTDILNNTRNITTNVDSKNTTETKKPELPKKQTEELGLEVEMLHMQLPKPEKIEIYKNRLAEITKIEKKREDDESARSNLEAYLFEIKSKVEEDSSLVLKKYLNETEYKSLLENIQSVDEWFSEFGYSANMTECNQQKSKIRDIVKQATFRSKEKSLLADYSTQINSTLSTVENLMSYFKSLPSNFTETNENLLDTAEISYKTLSDLFSKYPQQLKLEPWDVPILTSKELKAKNRTLSQDARKLADKVIAYEKEMDKLKQEAEEKLKSETNETDASTDDKTEETKSSDESSSAKEEIPTDIGKDVDPQTDEKSADIPKHDEL